MTSRSLAMLVFVNAVLLAALALTTFSPSPAAAQFGGGRSYTMISGEVTGRNNQAAVYIIDLSSSAVAPVFYNGSKKEFEFFGGTIVSDDAARVGQTRR